MDMFIIFTNMFIQNAIKYCKVFNRDHLNYFCPSVPTLQYVLWQDLIWDFISPVGCAFNYFSCKTKKKIIWLLGSYPAGIILLRGRARGARVRDAVHT